MAQGRRLLRRAPSPKQEEPEEQQNGAPPGSPRQPFGAPPVTSDWQTNGRAEKGAEAAARAAAAAPEQRVGVEAEAPSQRIRKAPQVTFDKAALLKLRKRTVLLESMRAALPREITSNDPLDPLSINRRPTVEQIGQQWARAQPVGSASAEGARAAENGEALERGRKGAAASISDQKEKGPWERGMSVPQRQAGGEKLWDDLDAETFGDHDGSCCSQ